MVVADRRALALFFIMATMSFAGCLDLGETIDSRNDVITGQDIHLDLNDLRGDYDWVLYRVDAGDGQNLVAGTNGVWNWDRGLIDGPAYACPVTSIAGSGPLEPVWTPDDVDRRFVSGATDVYTVSASAADQSQTLRASAGIGVGIASLHVAGSNPSQPTYLLGGFGEAEEWENGQGTFEFSMETRSLSWSAIDFGAFSCGAGFDMFEGGTWLEGPLGSVGRDLSKEFELQRGAAIWLRFDSDMSYQARLIAPNGTVWEFGSTATVAVGGQPQPWLVCSHTEGTWTLEILEVTSLERERGNVRYVAMDIPPEGQRALRCRGAEGLFDMTIDPADLSNSP